MSKDQKTVTWHFLKSLSKLGQMDKTLGLLPLGKPEIHLSDKKTTYLSISNIFLWKCLKWDVNYLPGNFISQLYALF